MTPRFLRGTGFVRKTLAITFRSLSVRNFRLFATGQIASVTGTWMMVVAQDWLVLELTGDSSAALATVTAMQFTPLLLLTLYGGGLADRHDKRALLTAANLVSGLLALVLALLVLTGTAGLWHLYGFALALGIVNAVEIPTRMAFVSELVGAELLPNASALSAAYFNVARVLGPALAGLLISVAGTGPVMLLNAASYLATVAGLRGMRVAELRRSTRPATHLRVIDGLTHLRTRPDLVLTLALVAVVGLFGLNLQLTLPLMAKTVFHTDAASFGLLTTALAAGSLLAAFAGTARRGRPSARAVTASAFAFGLLETAAGWAPGFTSALVLLALTGFASMYFAQAANHRIQLGSDPRYRGRVMALYTLILQGSVPLGALFVGLLAEHLGARSGLYVGGLISLTAALAAAAADRLRTGPGHRRTASPPADVHVPPRSTAGSPPMTTLTALAVGAAELHLWLLRPPGSVRELPTGELDVNETRRAAALRRPSDRLLYVAAHIGLRRIMAAYTGIAPDRLSFGREPCPGCGAPHGRPVLRDTPDAPQFSLSHSQGLALIAVAAVRLGADVQKIPSTQTTELCLPALHPAERLELRRLPAQDRNLAFARLWVRKEAYLKGLGTGLTRGARTDYLGEYAAGERPPGWLVRNLPAGPGHVAAAALPVDDDCHAVIRALPADWLYAKDPAGRIAGMGASARTVLRVHEPQPAHRRT
ncbi:MFS transporter [Streptomyces sp. NPDC054841]